MRAEIIVTEEQAALANGAGIDPREFLQMRFREDHGLEFTLEDFQNEQAFTFEVDEAADIYRVIFHGQGALT